MTRLYSKRPLKTMILNRPDGTLVISAETYTLTFAKDRPFVYVDDTAGARVAELFALSSVHPLHGRDDTTRAGAWAVEQAVGETAATLQAESSAWRSKAYRFRRRPRRFTYEIEVAGDRRLAEDY